MSEREYVNSTSVCPPPGSFHWAAKSGNTVYLAGQVGIGKDGNTVGVGDAAALVKQAFSNIEVTLKDFCGVLNSCELAGDFLAHATRLKSPRRKVSYEVAISLTNGSLTTLSR